jgi:hypothetical protein
VGALIGSRDVAASHLVVYQGSIMEVDPG